MGGKVNVQQYEMLRLLEKLGVIRITYRDDAFAEYGTVYVEVEEGTRW